jgi:hypothetical protein
MATTKVFTLEGSSVSNGSTETLTESDDQSWNIEKVQVTEESGGNLGGGTATISIAGDSTTDQVVAVETLRDSYGDLPTLDLDWPSNTQFEFDFSNNTGGSVTINVSLWVEPA